MFELRKMILKKIIVATFATLIWCLLLSVVGYLLQGEQEPNTSYMTFMGHFVLYLIFIAPVFLTIGILFSIVVDEIKNKSIFKTIFTYVIGGGIIGFLYYLLIVIMQANSNILSSGVILFISYGASSALFFYVIQIILKPLFSKLNLN